MDDVQSQEKNDLPDRDPAQLLEEQRQLIQSLNQSMRRQQKLLEESYKQRRKQTEWLASIGSGLFPQADRYSSQQQVKVVDVNMPFMALVGFLVKVSLAAIPAALIL